MNNIESIKNNIESSLADDEKMEDAFINNIVATLTTIYTIVNSRNLVIQNFRNNQTFLNLVKICYGTLLIKATNLEAGQELPETIMINSDSNIENNLSRMSIDNNNDDIKGESGKIYYDKDKKLVSLYLNNHSHNNDTKKRVDLSLQEFQTFVIDTLITWIYMLDNHQFITGSIQGGFTDWRYVIGEILAILLNTLPDVIISEISEFSTNSTQTISRGGTRKRKRKTNTKKNVKKGSRNKKHKKH